MVKISGTERKQECEEIQRTYFQDSSVVLGYPRHVGI